MPRADYDKALNRASAPETALQEMQTQQQEQKIESLVNQAVQEGKIAPASVEYHKAACRAEGGIKQFEGFVKTAPPVIPDVTTPHQAPANTTLDSADKQIFEMLGVEEGKKEK